MERSEPSLVPEWYRGTGSSASATTNFNPPTWSSHSATDELSSVFSSRNRLPMSLCDHDSPHSLSLTDHRTSSSFHLSASSSTSKGREKDLPSRSYSSSSRSHHDRNWDREKEHDLRERDRSLLVEDGLSNYTESLITTKSEKESLRRSHSLASGRLGDSWLKRSGLDLSIGIPSRGNNITGISKSSFEREFPSLGADDKNVGSDVTRVASPGLTAAIHNIPLTASTIIGGDGWTSALAEVPPIVGGNGSVVSSVLPTSSALTIALNASTGLNMAETVAQTPIRVRTTSQLPSDSQKIEELHRLQIMKLRPVTPLVPKNLGLNSAEKSKAKVARTVEFSASKTGQQSSSHIVIHGARSAVRSDVSKISQPGNFKVLNRERNSSSPTGKGSRKPTNLFSVPATPSRVLPPPKGPLNMMLKVDAKGGALSSSSYAEKKLPSQAQNRSDFFNSLRKKASAANDGPNGDASSFNLEKVDEQFTLDSISAKNDKAENQNCSAGGCDTFEEPEKLDPDEEEASFLRSLGWEENAGVEALTREEIESFLSVYKSRRPASKSNV